MHFSSIAAILIVSLSNLALSQSAKPDSSFVQFARNQGVDFYEQTVKLQAHVYEGDQYINHDPRIKIHPYYVVDSLQTGTVVYKNVAYKDVAMLYDIVRDQLVVQPPEGGYRLRLNMDKVSQFSMGPYRFARIAGDSAAGVRTGFYEIIYNGTVKALAQRLKTIHEDISGGSYKADYQSKDHYIIQKDGTFHVVKTKRSVLSLFSDQARALRKYMRANKLKFKEEQRGQSIAKLTQRYDELTH